MEISELIEYLGKMPNLTDEDKERLSEELENFRCFRTYIQGKNENEAETFVDDFMREKSSDIFNSINENLKEHVTEINESLTKLSNTECLNGFYKSDNGFRDKLVLMYKEAFVEYKEYSDFDKAVYSIAFVNETVMMVNTALAIKNMEEKESNKPKEEKDNG